MSLRILHLITDLGVGGAEHMLEKLVTGMDRTEFSNTVVSLIHPEEIGLRLQQAGVEVHYLNMAQPGSFLTGIFRLRRLLSTVQPHVLQTWLYHADLVGTLTHLVSRREKLVWNLRCSDMDMSNYSVATRLVLWLLAPLSRVPDRIVSNSEAGRRHHVDLGYRKDGWLVLPNGFDLEAFRSDTDGTIGEALRRQLGIPTGRPIVGMIARLDPMKDHANFLAMAQTVRAARPDTHFVLIGRGCKSGMPWCMAAEQEFGPQLHLLGERNDVAALLPGFDVLTLTSAYGEGFPNVLGEALAAGVPSVATDVGDAAIIIDTCGQAVPPRDPQAMAEAVLRILGLPAEQRRAWRQQIRQRAEALYDLKSVIRRYEDFYRSLAQA